MSATICPSCLNMTYEDGRCGNCGFSRAGHQAAPTALPVDSMIGPYSVGVLKATSRQSQIYTGIHSETSKPVIIEEFFPNRMAGRAKGKTDVVLSSASLETSQRFQQGCSLIAASTQARPLARIEVIQANRTVYGIFEPKPGIPVEAQCESLADNPVFFRTPKGQVEMTINLLKIPPFPKERPYNANQLTTKIEPQEPEMASVITMPKEIGDDDARIQEKLNSEDKRASSKKKGKKKKLWIPIASVCCAAILGVGIGWIALRPGDKSLTEAKLEDELKVDAQDPLLTMNLVTEEPKPAETRKPLAISVSKGGKSTQPADASTPESGEEENHPSETVIVAASESAADAASEQTEEPVGEAISTPVPIPTPNGEATSDAVETLKGEETSDPSDTVTPEVTTEPTGTTTAEVTTEPTGTTTAEVTTEPTGTTTAEVTTEPTGTTTAEATMEPTGTTTAEAAPEPTGTTTAEATLEPIRTTAVESTQESTEDLPAKSASNPTESPTGEDAAGSTATSTGEGVTPSNQSTTGRVPSAINPVLPRESASPSTTAPIVTSSQAPMQTRTSEGASTPTQQPRQDPTVPSFNPGRQQTIQKETQQTAGIQGSPAPSNEKSEGSSSNWMSFTNVQGGEWDDEPPVVDDHLFSKQKGVQGEYYYYKMKDATQDWNTEMIQFENVEITLTQDALMCAFSMSGTQNVTRIDVEVSLGGFYHKWSASPDNTKKNQDDKTFLLKKDQKNKDGFWDNIEDIQGEKLTVTFTCVTKNAGIERKDRYVQVP